MAVVAAEVADLLCGVALIATRDFFTILVYSDHVKTLAFNYVRVLSILVVIVYEVVELTRLLLFDLCESSVRVAKYAGGAEVQ